jgi:hypothetical protein
VWARVIERHDEFALGYVLTHRRQLQNEHLAPPIPPPNLGTQLRATSNVTSDMQAIRAER